MRAGFPLLVVIFLIIGVGGGVAFGGGVVYGRNSAPQSKAASTSAPAAGSANPVTQAVVGGGSPGTAGTQGQRGNIGGTAGAIDSLSGNTLTVRTQQGTLTTVNLTADTRLLTTTVATRDDLKTGATVTVIGAPPDQNGVITANSVTITPPGLNPQAQGTASAGGQGGAGGQRGGTPAARRTPTPTP